MLGIVGFFLLLTLILFSVQYGDYRVKRHTVPMSALWSQGEYVEAIPHLEALVKIFPEHENYQRMLGQAYLENDQAELALEEFQQVLELDRRAKLDAEIGMAYGELDQLDEAKVYLDRAVKQNPDHAGVNFFLGVHHLENRRYYEAAEAFFRASVDPEWAERADPYQQQIAETILGEALIPQELAAAEQSEPEGDE